MSAWRGLHNHAKHILPDRDDGAVCPCLPEGEWCWRESPCHCCLASEVERLTAALTERDRRIEAALALHARGDRCVARSVNEHSCSGWKCSGCYGHWPCRTVVALRGES